MILIYLLIVMLVIHPNPEGCGLSRPLNCKPVCVCRRLPLVRVSSNSSMALNLLKMLPKLKLF